MLPAFEVAQAVSLPVVTPATVGIETLMMTVSLLSSHIPLLIVHSK
jgi:hypothetical protein